MPDPVTAGMKPSAAPSPDAVPLDSAPNVVATPDSAPSAEAAPRTADAATARPGDSPSATGGAPAFAEPPISTVRVTALTLGAWALASALVALAAFSMDEGEAAWIGVAIGLGLGLVDTIATSIIFVAQLRGAGSTVAMFRVMLYGFLVRLVVVVGVWVVLWKLDVGHYAFVFSFFGCHLMLITALVLVGKNWLNALTDARQQAETTAAP